MNGKLIVIDGLDGSGKSTQAKILYETLKEKSKKVLLISYPDYDEPSSALVKMYLNGEFSSDPNDVNAYAASTFYAADRYAGYMKFWKEKYNDGYIIIASRYVSSNAIHQMVKLPEEKWDEYLSWLDDYEFSKLSLPRPDMVIFLDMDRKVADNLIMSRYNGDEEKKDIHESDLEYLKSCNKSASYAAKVQGWKVIPCSDDKNAFPIDIISDKILSEAESIL